MFIFEYIRCDCDTPAVRRETDRCSGEACCGVAAEFISFFARAAQIE